MIHIQLFVGSRLWNILAEMSLVRLACFFFCDLRLVVLMLQ